ncbi:MAG TPA: DegT/DnrJ/EryC1/StrS family aminotransferase [Acidimicrobiia bacterium]|jgi:dTDP-4-amino-4,6-dideoxygalactose transaminase
MIGIASVEIGAEEETLALEVLRSGQLAQGPMVERLESEFTALTGTRHAVAVSSGTTALVAALEALDVGAGDEVVTSAFTFVATLNAILEAGATATFVDIGDDFGIATESLAAAIGPATRAVLPVHLYGLPADVVGIARVADQHAVALVEDASQAHGATAGGRPVGSFGVGCFSLYATKHVTAGEGGVVTCDDDALADRLRLLRNQGMRERYCYEIPGHNYRLTDLQAAIAIPQVRRLTEATARRAANAAMLDAALDGVPGLVRPTTPAGRTHVWHQYTVRVTPAARCSRDELARALAARGIETGIYYPHVVFDHECYRDHPRVKPADVPNARAAAREVLSLPVHSALAERDVATIGSSVREVLGC